MRGGKGCYTVVTTQYTRHGIQIRTWALTEVTTEGEIELTRASSLRPGSSLPLIPLPTPLCCDHRLSKPLLSTGINASIVGAPSCWK